MRASDVASMKTVMVPSRAEVVASSRRNYTQLGASKSEFEENRPDRGHHSESP
jgi:hypothetical protein